MFPDHLCLGADGADGADCADEASSAGASSAFGALCFFRFARLSVLRAFFPVFFLRLLPTLSFPIALVDLPFKRFAWCPKSSKNAADDDAVSAGVLYIDRWLTAFTIAAFTIYCSYGCYLPMCHHQCTTTTIMNIINHDPCIITIDVPKLLSRHYESRPRRDCHFGFVAK